MPQQQRDKSLSQISQHKHQGQQHHARLQHEAADVLSADPVLQRQMQDMSDYALNLFPGVTQQHALHPDIPLSRLVATAIRRDKQWAGMWSLAIALKRSSYCSEAQHHGDWQSRLLHVLQE